MLMDDFKKKATMKPPMDLLNAKTCSTTLPRMTQL